MKLLHISDLHFFSIPKNPLKLFNKRILGVTNTIFLRGKLFSRKRVDELLQFLEQENIDRILITGDLTTTSLLEEFRQAASFLQQVQNLNIKIYAVSGNHDQYTQGAFKEKRFYRALKEWIPFQGEYGFDLSMDKVAAFPLSTTWTLICFETTRAEPFLSSRGYFDVVTENNLRRLLSLIPKHHKIIFATHFPYIPYKYPKAHLARGDQLKRLLEEDPRIKLYLHGHRHTHGFYRKPCLTADAGSITYKYTSTANLLTFRNDETLLLEKYRYKETIWSPDDKKESFTLV